MAANVPSQTDNDPSMYIYIYILDRKQVKLIVKPNKQRCMQTSNRLVWLICQLWQNIKLACSLVSIKFVAFLAMINSIYYKSIGKKKRRIIRVLLQSIKCIIIANN